MILQRVNGKWAPRSLRGFSSESELQLILSQAPELVPGGTGCAVVRELWIPDAGLLDIAMIDSDANLTLVECKLNKNPEIRRAVVGQLLGYAGGLHRMSADDFSARWADRAKQSVFDHVSEVVGAEPEPETFRERLTRTLLEGSFRLVFAVDEITDELKRVVELLNAHTSGGLSVLALELGYVKEGELELLVPQTYGAELAQEADARGSQSPTRRWSREAIAEALQNAGESPRRVVEDLIAHADRNDATFKGGAGRFPSAGFYYQTPEGQRSLWSLYVKPAGPVIAINLGSIAAHNPVRAQAMAAALKESANLSAVLGDAPAEQLMTRWPEIGVADSMLVDEDLSAVIGALDAGISQSVLPLRSH